MRLLRTATLVLCLAALTTSAFGQIPIESTVTWTVPVGAPTVDTPIAYLDGSIIQLDNGGIFSMYNYNYSNPANGAKLILTNDVRVDAFGGGLGLVRRDQGNGWVMAQSGDILLNGPLAIGGPVQVYEYGNMAGIKSYYQGAITLGGTTAGLRALVAQGLAGLGPVSVLSGRISDGAGPFVNALVIRNDNFGSTVISNTTNNYTGGTIIESARYSGQTGYYYGTTLAAGANLGSGLATIRGNGQLTINSTSNILAGQLNPISTKLSNGTLEIGNESIPMASLASKIASTASGTIAFYGAHDAPGSGDIIGTGETLDFATLGNGKMWLGATDGAYWGYRMYDMTVRPGSDNVYRVDTQQFIALRGIQTDNSLFNGTGASAIIRGNGSVGKEVQSTIGELALTGGVTLDHVNFVNTNEGQVDTNTWLPGTSNGVVNGGIIHPFGNGNLDMIGSTAQFTPIMFDGQAHTFDARVGAV